MAPDQSRIPTRPAEPAEVFPGPAPAVEAVEDLVDEVLRITGVRMEGEHGVFHGTPRPGSADAFDRVAGEMRARGFRPSLLEAAAGEATLVVSPVARAPDLRSRPVVQLGLLIATLVTTTWAGAAHAGVDLLRAPGSWMSGLPYALALLLILGVHEMGHYVVARARRVRVSLPYFIPAPFFLGTFGAFIRMGGDVKDRNDYFDIGVAGPLAGLVVAALAVLIGASAPASGVAGHGMVPASSLLFTLLYQAGGGIDPGVVTALGPVAFAGWLGLLVTALNLIPVGQLDGGHVAYALWGRERSRILGVAVIGAMIALGLLYSRHWLMWGLLVWLVAGTAHPPSTNELRPLTPGRKALAWATVGLFLLIILPWPG
jgi:membrane-associated protease RseP (regulator of RpoE activity)